MFTSGAPLQLTQNPIVHGRRKDSTRMRKQQSTNMQQQTSNSGRMRWRTKVVEKTLWMEKQQWHGNGQATMVNGRRSTMALMITTAKQQSTNVQQQSWRRTTAGKRQQMSNNGAVASYGGQLQKTIEAVLKGQEQMID
jgi:hypothetical protein